jgi:serine/threonine-protein kinase
VLLRKGKPGIKQPAGTGQRWRWAPGLFALLLVLGLAQSGVLQPLERFIYNQTLSHFAPDGRSGKVVVFELPQDDEQWSQAQLAELMKRTWRARAVGLIPPLERNENHLAQAIVARRLEAIPDEGKRSQEPWPTLEALQQELDVESRLADGIRNSANVILAASWRPVAGGASAMLNEQFGVVAPSTIPVVDRLPSVITPSILHTDTLRLPRDALREAAAGIGLLSDGSEGRYPALIEHKGEGYPGMLFQLLRLNARAMGEGQVEFLARSRVQLGPLLYPTDRAWRLYPYAHLQGASLSGIEVYPLAVLLEGEYNSKHFENKTILIGHTGDDSPLVPLAMSLDALLQQRAVEIPLWAVWGQYGALAVVALLLMFLLPRLRFSTSSVTVLLAILLLANGEFLLLLLGKQWLPLMLSLLTLLLGYPLVSLRGALSSHGKRLELQLCETNRQLGRMLQNQGELEQALEKYRRCRVDEELLAQLYHLGLDFERKRQFSKAVSVFRHIEEQSAGFRDVAERIQRNQAVEQRIVLAKGGPATPTGTVIMTSEGLQKPTLGHYQIEREIGRGAMGMVYLGKDPRIGREVAIKTMALSAEFEGAQLKEVKERFYREAETAGRLNHPNIVHIYDIGEDQELAYIAMDYLRGENLASFIRQDSLLPIKEVLAIAEQVAEALDYAHRKNVVHRDIKPANIIYDRGEAVVKVTDFGVACLTDSSKTKTGTVLGSPSYMSPEQVAGRKVDGRADIFSLGVTLFQLVTGNLPFEADTLGSLMYKITNEEHPKPGKFRKGIPACVSRIINKCMQKDPDKRYPNGGELAIALRRCRK